MTNQFDIHKHQWSDTSLIVSDVNEELIFTNNDYLNRSSLDKSDAIAIAKHFRLIKDTTALPPELFTFGESTVEMDEGAKKAFRRIPQSETIIQRQLNDNEMNQAPIPDKYNSCECGGGLNAANCVNCSEVTQ